MVAGDGARGRGQLPSKGDERTKMVARARSLGLQGRAFWGQRLRTMRALATGLCLLGVSPGCGTHVRASDDCGSGVVDAPHLLPRWERVEGTFPWYDHSATRLTDGTVLIAGGSTSWDWRKQQGRRETYRFDPASNRLQPDEPMTFARRAHRATLLGDGRVMVAGGFDSGIEKPWSPTPLGLHAEVFDPRAPPGKRWRRLPNPYGEVYREDYPGLYQGLLMALPSGEVLLALGDYYYPLLSGIAGPIEFFDPQTEVWRASDEPSFGYSAMETAAIIGDDGAVLSFSGARTSEVLRIDPVSGQRSVVARLLARRRNAAVVRRAAGSYWVIGGEAWSEDEPPVAATAERVDVPSGEVTRVSLDDAYTMLRATVLSSGVVLLFGYQRLQGRTITVGLFRLDGSYRRLLRLPYTGGNITATPLLDDSVLLCGDIEAANRGDVGAILRFYPEGL